MNGRTARLLRKFALQQEQRETAQPRRLIRGRYSFTERYRSLKAWWTLQPRGIRGLLRQRFQISLNENV
jgi:hypothetical protein